MAGQKARVRNGMSSADESDILGLATDFVSGAGVVDMDTDFIVTQDTGLNRQVAITLGNVYINNSAYARSQGLTKYMVGENEDNPKLLAVTPNTTLATRVDYVCVKYDNAVSPNSDASNSVISFVVVAGTSNGVAPTIPSNHLVIARLDLPQNYTAVTNAMITDMRVQTSIDLRGGWTLIDKSEDPLAVSGSLAIMQYVSATQLKIYGDWRSKIGKNVKLKIWQSGGYKYFVTDDAGSYSASYTTYTIKTNGTYSLTNAVITKAYYSNSFAPVGMSDTLLPVIDVTQSNSMARQALINSNFDIWQRSTSQVLSDAIKTFTADHWWEIAVKDGGTPPTLTRSRQLLTNGDIPNSFYYTRLTTNGAGSGFGANSYHSLAQSIENGTRFLAGAGKKVTVSFWARSSISNKKLGIAFYQYYGTGGSPSAGEDILGTTFTLTSSWVRYTYTFTLNTLVGKTFGTNNDDDLRLTLWSMIGSGLSATRTGATISSYEGSGTIDIAQVQVCANEVALPYSPKSFAEELQACQRYYAKTFPYATTPAQGAGFAGSISGQAVTSGAFLYKNWYLPVRMRSNSPSVTTYNPVSANNQWRDQNASVDKSSAVNAVSDSAITIAMNTTATAGNLISIHATAEAEL